MKRFIKLVGAAFVMATGVGAGLGAEPAEGKPLAIRVVVTADELADAPASPMICGNFIEAGFGRQTEGMWAQMLFNGSFEEIPPYTAALYDTLGHGPKDDLAAQPWWHSGYEENPWELAPGNDEAKWRRADHVGFWRGQWGGWLANPSKTRWAAVIQRGLYLRKGETYRFTSMLRTGRYPWDLASEDVSIQAELRLYPEGGGAVEPIARKTIDGIGKGLSPKSCTIANADHEGRATFGLWIPPETNLGMDDLSLMPASNVQGWRRDVIELSRRLRPPIVRWPGGCFASFYHWRDGIGPRSERRPVTSWFWGGLYDNDVGTPEFVQFCRLIDAAPLLCVNMMTGSADEAADWVAYCNAPADHPVGRLRARDGFAEPFRVKYWELENEPYRRFTPDEYAQRCAEFARQMRAVDPTIELAVVGYDPFRPHVGEILEICGQHVQYVIDRATDEETLRGVLDAVRDYNKRHGRRVRLCNTEWPAPEWERPANVDEAALAKIPNVKGRQRCWYSALNVARILLTFQRLGGDLAFSNFNNFANTWGQNAIECPKETTYLAPVGEVMELFVRSPAAWPLALSVDDKPEGVEIQAAWNADRTALCVNVINYRDDAVTLRFDLGRLRRKFAQCDATVLWADSLTSYATPERPNVVQRGQSKEKLSDGAALDLSVRPYALVHAVLE